MFTELEELVSKPLALSVAEIEKAYRSPEAIMANRDAIVEMSGPRRFIEMLNAYKQYGDQLVNENILWVFLNYFQRKENCEVRHIYEVTATCYNHQAPKTVAKAYIRQQEAAQFPSLEDCLKTYRFKHSSLVYSHHEERIEEGRLMCKDCGKEAEFSPETKIHELVATARNRRETEKAITKWVCKNLEAGSEDVVERELKTALGVGNDYATIYNALEQTRFYAVTLKDLFQKGYICYPNLRNALNDGNFVKRLEEEIARKIRPPILVVETRIKGQSFADKLLLKGYEKALNEDLANGRLARFLEQMEIPARDEYRFGIGDLVGIMAIVHGDAVTYDVRSGNYEMPCEELAAQNRVYKLLAHFLNMEAGKVREIGPERVYIPERKIEVLEVKDYIKRPKPSGYRACHLILKSTFLQGIPIRFELQAKTNFMDTLAELTDRQNHDSRKLEQRMLVQYLIENRKLTPARIAAYRTLLSPGQEYR